jgi:DNA-binding PadR family transcriptional regulator
MLQKDVVACFAYMSLLIELAKGKALSGYDVLVHVKQFGLAVSPGTVYHQLRRLVEKGYIQGMRVNGKTVYAMTEQGLQQFSEFKESQREPIRYLFKNLID